MQNFECTVEYTTGETYKVFAMDADDAISQAKQLFNKEVIPDSKGRGEQNWSAKEVE